MAQCIQEFEPAVAFTTIQDNHRGSQESGVSVSARWKRIREAHEATAHQSSASNMAAPQTPILDATTSSQQHSNDESKVWQCIEQLSLIMGEMVKKEEKATPWKPSANMAPDTAKAGMGLTDFRVWARSVMDYSKACKWPKEQEAMSVRLLCDESIKKAIDARVK